jgi:hypothetical protein
MNADFNDGFKDGYADGFGEGYNGCAFFEADSSNADDDHVKGYNSGFDVGYNKGFDLREKHGLEG